eukprot:3574381-Amphidinium_carterae.1
MCIRDRCYGQIKGGHSMWNRGGKEEANHALLTLLQFGGQGGGATVPPARCAQTSSRRVYPVLGTLAAGIAKERN